MKKLSSTLPNMLLSLGGICVVVSGILALVNRVTTAPIAEAEMRAKVEAIRAVAQPFDNNPFAEKLRILPEGETWGHASLSGSTRRARRAAYVTCVDWI